MDFKDILEKYKLGLANEEERQFIENELEKNKLINEFIMEEYEFKSFNKEELQFNKSDIKNELDYSILDKDFSKKINKKINMRVYKSILKTIGLIISLFLIWNFCLYPLLNRMYYNPNRVFYNPKSYSSKNEIDDYQLVVDMEIINELFSPIEISTYVKSENLGIGKYEIKMHRKNLFNGEERYLEFIINKNKSEMKNDFRYINEELGTLNFKKFSDEKKDLKDIKNLNENIDVLAYVNLRADLTIEEAESIIDKYNLKSNFLKVKSTDIGNIPLGFNPNSEQPYYFKEYVDMERYPNIFMDDLKKEEYQRKEEHFLSMLSYVADREELIESFYSNFNTNIRSQYNYIKENGVKIEGFLVQGEVYKIKELSEDESTLGIFVEDVLSYKY